MDQPSNTSACLFQSMYSACVKRLPPSTTSAPTWPLARRPCWHCMRRRRWELLERPAAGRQRAAAGRFCRWFSNRYDTYERIACVYLPLRLHAVCVCYAMKKAEDQERDEATRQGTSTVVVVVVVVFNLPPAPSPTYVNQIEDMHHNAGMHGRGRGRAPLTPWSVRVCLWTCT
jgi:hypothetical protein